MRILYLTIAIVLQISSCGSSAKKLPDDSYFYQPQIGNTEISITPSAGSDDDTQLFINAINSLPNEGGVIKVARGTYHVLNIPFKSGVHFRIAAGSKLIPFNAENGVTDPIFLADGEQTINNFSLIGDGGRFTIDMSNVQATQKIRAILFANAENFKISDINIIDNYTAFSALAFTGNFESSANPNGPGRAIDSVNGVPNKGIIENLSIINANYGYGLIQVQVGHRLKFKNLKTTGGVALRLETGADLLQTATGDILSAIRLNDIWARNLSCTNGQSALQLSPHTLDHGWADVWGVKATSCEYGVVQSAGFLTTDEAAMNLTPGSFSSETKVGNVTVTFGQNAQLHPSKRLRYLPCQLRTARDENNQTGISITLNIDEESRTGPSIGTVIREDDKVGAYQIDLSTNEVEAIGFNIANHYLPTKAFVTNDTDDYEVCNEEVDGINFFVPRESRNTPNPRNPLE